MMVVDERNDRESSEGRQRRLRGRNLALALVLLALAVLFYAVTLVKGPGVVNPGI